MLTILRDVTASDLPIFFGVVKTRPLFARMAKHNIGSQRVLEKCGFKVTGEDKYVKNGKDEVEELVFRLDANER